MRHGISEPARGFISRHVYSVGQLEILLHAWSRPGQLLTPEDVARHEKLAVERTSEVMVDLARRGMLEASPDGYSYNPSGAHASAVDSVADAYRTHRVSVINLIFAGPPTELRDFADSFRMRRDEE